MSCSHIIGQFFFFTVFLNTLVKVEGKSGIQAYARNGARGIILGLLSVKKLSLRYWAFFFTGDDCEQNSNSKQKHK